MRKMHKAFCLALLIIEIIALLVAHLANWLGIFFILINAILFWLGLKVRQNESTLESLDMPRLDASVRIANETLPYLRRGLNQATAEKTAEIIQKISEVAAVAITDRENVLAYLGAGCDKHNPGDPILTETTRMVIATGVYKIARNQAELNCSRRDNCDCPLGAAVVVPLKCKDETVGTVKLYQAKGSQLNPQIIRLALGMAQLLGMQMELAELDRQAQLAAEAELDALQAQINPHFFFNTLNTIIMYSRTNPNRARRLLIRLSDFFREALKRQGSFISLQEEMNFVHTYLVLEKARFGSKLKIIEHIEPDLFEKQIPRLTLQPLVENAVKHGITPKLGQGAIKIVGRREAEEIIISVEDDGVGIPVETLSLVLQPGYGSGNGVGMSNVHERLKGLYGEDYGLQIATSQNAGTTVTMRIPLSDNLRTNC
ncbi:MAG TPA: histidine kinase [Desulfobacteria bacterium]|nr:histidine kinase [Desulfobacteria bacterium]